MGAARSKPRVGQLQLFWQNIHGIASVRVNYVLSISSLSTLPLNTFIFSPAKEVVSIFTHQSPVV